MAVVLRLTSTSQPRHWEPVPRAFHLQGETLLGQQGVRGRILSREKGLRHQPDLTPSSAAAPQCCSEDQACSAAEKGGNLLGGGKKKIILDKCCNLILQVQQRRSELIPVTGVSHFPWVLLTVCPWPHLVCPLLNPPNEPLCSGAASTVFTSLIAATS